MALEDDPDHSIIQRDKHVDFTVVPHRYLCLSVDGKEPFVLRPKDTLNVTLAGAKDVHITVPTAH